jgi:peroxiredoxin Q/BCP
MNLKSLLSFAVALLTAVANSHAEPPKDFTVESPTHGTKFTLSTAKGKIVALHFLLKTECPFCLKHTHAFAAQAANSPDVMHVFLKPDSAAEIKKWAAHLSKDGLAQAPVIFRDADAKLAKAFAIPDGYKFHGQTVHFPALVVLDGTGRELFRHVGKDNTDRLSVEEFTRRLAASASATAR